MAPWESIRLRVDLDRFRRIPGDPSGHLCLALLLLVLRDLADGWLTLGFGGTRGRGHVAVSEIRFSGRALPAPWSALSATTLEQVIADPPAQVLEAMSRWADHFTEERRLMSARTETTA
jgi:hypothetical protein